MQKLSGIKIVLLVVAVVIAVITIMMVTKKDEVKEDSTIFGEVKVKSSKDRSEEGRLSNYETIKREKGKPEGKKLRYKVKVKKENPFLSLYKEEKKPEIKQEQKEKEPAKQKESIPVKQLEQPDTTSGFFSIHNAEVDQEKIFFKAIFRETQQVQNGKALRIILQEPIPILNLESGIILKGIPTFVGERIHIHITAGIIGKEVRQLDLICFDKEDLIEGVFHDELAKQLEEATKEGLIDEVLELDFKGSEIARKANNLTKFYKNIVIDKGREIFVSIPQKEE